MTSCLLSWMTNPCQKGETVDLVEKGGKTENDRVAGPSKMQPFTLERINIFSSNRKIWKNYLKYTGSTDYQLTVHFTDTCMREFMKYQLAYLCGRPIRAVD